MGVMVDETSIREVGVQEGYAIWAASYDQESNGLIILEERQVERLLAPLSFRNVLDVGTGTGRHALRFARRGANVTALDQSEAMLAVARQVAEREGLSIAFHLRPLEEPLPFDAEQFDLVICALALCHVPDLRPAVAEFAHVLQPGGYLLITDFHPDHVLYGWRTGFRREGVIYRLPTVGHTERGYLEAITASGMVILEVAESLMGDAPVGSVPEETRRAHSDKPFCLGILARKSPI